MAKKILIGGGVMADKIKFGREVVALVNPKADQKTVQEFFNLISASPDLLDALIEITGELDFQYDSANGTGGVMEQARKKIIDKCRKAINLASGKYV